VRLFPTATNVALVALAALVVGCGVFVAPAPTPAEMDDVISNLVLRGVTVHDLVSGDTGCSIPTLQGNAVHMEISLETDSSIQTVYLLRWRRASDFAGSSQEFADCVAQYQAAHPGQTISQLEANPWRAYGPAWTPVLRDTLLDALHASGGG
jgi:hypothetical protein